MKASTKNTIKRIIKEEIQRQISERKSDNSVKASQAVNNAIKKLSSSSAMDYISRIQNDIQKAQLIMKFSELIGIPKSKLQMIIGSIKKTAE